LRLSPSLLLPLAPAIAGLPPPLPPLLPPMALLPPPLPPLLPPLAPLPPQLLLLLLLLMVLPQLLVCNRAASGRVLQAPLITPPANWNHRHPGFP
jgi:hypothetical protein